MVYHGGVYLCHTIPWKMILHVLFTLRSYKLWKVGTPYVYFGSDVPFLVPKSRFLALCISNAPEHQPLVFSQRDIYVMCGLCFTGFRVFTRGCAGRRRQRWREMVPLDLAPSATKMARPCDVWPCVWTINFLGNIWHLCPYCLPAVPSHDFYTRSYRHSKWKCELPAPRDIQISLQRVLVSAQ